MKVEFFKKQINDLDVKSDEFFDLYKTISDKYWTVKDPDDYQKASKALWMFAERGGEQLVIVLAQMLVEIIKMEKDVGGAKAVSGTCGFEDKEFFFTLSTDKTAIANLQKMMENMVIVQGKKEGKIK